MSLSRLQLGLVAAVAATCPVSIFAAQVLLALAVAVYLARIATGGAVWERVRFDAPFLAFAVWTLLATAFAADPLTSIESAKKLVLFSLLPLSVSTMQEPERRERVMDAALLGGLAMVLWGVTQYYVLGFDSPDRRPRSFLGHYMTASGLEMGVAILAAARLLFHRGPWRAPTASDLKALLGLVLALGVLGALKASNVFAVEAERLFVAGVAAAAAALAVASGPWPGASLRMALPALALPAAIWGLVVSQTRNTWLGTLAGMAVLGILRAPRLLWLLAAGVVGLLIVGPAPVMRRLTIADASSVDRYYMWQAGLDMIQSKPVFGHGPGMILSVYPQYRRPEAPNPRTPHLHNNALQIAAERGLPGLALWLWAMAIALVDAYREAKASARGAGWGAAAALALLVAALLAGMFEYNSGDSEVLMFTLLIVAFVYGLRRQRIGHPAFAR